MLLLLVHLYEQILGVHMCRLIFFTNRNYQKILIWVSTQWVRMRDYCACFPGLESQPEQKFFSNKKFLGIYKGWVANYPQQKCQCQWWHTITKTTKCWLNTVGLSCIDWIKNNLGSTLYINYYHLTKHNVIKLYITKTNYNYIFFGIYDWYIDLVYKVHTCQPQINDLRMICHVWDDLKSWSTVRFILDEYYVLKYIL